MIGGRKVRSNKGKRRGPRGTGKTRSGAPFRGRKVSAKRRSSAKAKAKRTRKVRSNKGKKRGARTGVTRSKRRFRGGGNIKDLLRKLSSA